MNVSVAGLLFGMEPTGLSPQEQPLHAAASRNAKPTDTVFFIRTMLTSKRLKYCMIIPF